MNDTELDTERGIWSKIRIYVHRFSLILQLAKYACTGDESDRNEINDVAANGAIRLADYFYLMADKFRIVPKSSNLKPQWKKLYDRLADNFTKKDFDDDCGRIEIPKDTARKHLARWELDGLVIREKQGYYAKNDI